MSKRPYVICLMMTSLDGKILGEKWGKDDRVQLLTKSFEEAHDAIGMKAWIVGRATMEKDFTKFARPVYKEGALQINRADFIATREAKSFAIAIDGNAKLGWESSIMLGDHVISILTEAVEDSYLAHLQEVGVSYIFAGATTVNLQMALEKLKTLFGIETLMLEGGGRINGSFLNEGLIDEFNQLLLPLADGRVETSSVFEIAEKDRKLDATLFKLESMKQIENDVIWLKYKTIERV
ncbi:Pyrimidine reductase, riboflavin biosynthesis [Filimonas lacunae]|uniref:Pyrimidine reductase, riboflavin biosynthesis n=1 Tax=Filimonas lacunae TaxID=477680 RepID=A0A173MPV2_9BACT|nr:RibD family protein [Filimonas lacunae]BAV09411.1 riboflavin-specific deaminase [Filimonas lacunae]SIS72646.1 Pyrimidine reductase, riboflavin biosynthesis [Filimonas lacunae]